MQAELDRVDREWEQERKKYYLQHNGSMAEPTNDTVVIHIGFMAGMGLLFLFTVYIFVAWQGLGASGPYVVIAVCAVVITVHGILNTSNVARAYKQAYNDYQARRTAVVQRYKEEA